MALKSTFRSTLPPGMARLGRGAAILVTLMLFSRTGAGQYLEIRTNTRPNVYYQWSHAVTGDFDNSGKLDLISSLSGTALVVFLDPSTNGVLTPTWNVPLPTYYGIGARLDTGDFNGDGNLDLFTINNGNLADVLLGQGNGTFTVVPFPIVLPSIVAIYDVRAGDLNQDGFDDVVLKSGDGAFGYLKAYLSNNLQWTESWSLTLNYIPVVDSVRNDFNGDGMLDLCWFVPGSLVPVGTPPPSLLNSTQIARGLGNGTFVSPSTFPIIFPTLSTIGVVQVTDVDRDGLTDVVAVIAGPTPTFRFLYGNTATTLEPEVTFNWPANLGTFWNGGGIWHLFTSDFEADGDVDFVRVGVFNVGQYPWWPFALGGMTFHVLNSTGYRTYAASVRQDVMIPPPAGSHYWPADYDQDGDVDFIGLPNSWFDVVYLDNTAIFGDGCPGTAGVPVFTQGNLAIGNAGYALSVSGAHPSSFAVLGLSLGKSPVVGCGVLLDLSPSLLILPTVGLGTTTTDLNGAATISLPLPAVPGLAGVTAYAQWFVADPVGGLVVGAGTYAASRARTLILW